MRERLGLGIKFQFPQTMQAAYEDGKAKWLAKAGCLWQNKKTSEPAPKLTPNLTQPRPQPVVAQDLKAQINENKNDICCPTCEKVVSSPLVMLKFVDGENRKINICPYCYHVLGNAETDKLSDSDFIITDSEKKLIR